MTKYFDELCSAMTLVSKQHNSFFIGQAVEYPGTAMYRTLEHIMSDKKLELPVFEDCQMGMAIGLSLAGYLPICIYPRINFLMIAMNQLLLHLDKIPLYSAYRPRVIIRTAIATPRPMDPGPQHLGSFVKSLRAMLKTVKIAILYNSGVIVPYYEEALKAPYSTIMVEFLGKY